MKDDEREHLREVVTARANLGDADALNILGSMFVDDALRLNDESLLDSAEENFMKAAAAGHVVAASFIETTWPRLKIEYQSKIRGLIGPGSNIS